MTDEPTEAQQRQTARQARRDEFREKLGEGLTEAIKASASSEGPYGGVPLIAAPPSDDPLYEIDWENREFLTEGTKILLKWDLRTPDRLIEEIIEDYLENHPWDTKRSR